ncbi:MAG TPA: NYN domain-containing protein [Alphaproteobacteria bacterium]|nr:NYN domain-containing protein [Alphaproteobacteria bacterium]
MTEVHSMEEKGSDVNLASHLLNDAWKDLFDQAVVISNDTDLVEPIRMVSVERRKPVVVVCPGRWQMALDLQRVANFKVHIRLSMLRAAQLPDPIPGTTIRKPATW